MTQHQKILDLLDSGAWTCTSFMYAKFIADPRTRLAELKKQGYDLQSRWCQNPDHRHDGQMKEWKLATPQVKPRLEPNFCCGGKMRGQEHSKDCPILKQRAERTQLINALF